jgi:tRNA pseudouridine32 synthase/23S rRNA pseudouridine746 synthase
MDSLLPCHYLDAHLLVLEKPPGLLTVPGRGPDKQDCLAARVQARHPDALIVHRLDQATSGLVLMARGAAMQRALSMAFAARRVHKRYVALVEGRLDIPADAQDGWSVIDLPLICDWPRRPRQKVDFTAGRPSRTRWRVLGVEGECTRLELEPVTGRSHQLCVHLLALGHPIRGDDLYGIPGPRLCLHASGLELLHPALGHPLRFESPAPF